MANHFEVGFQSAIQQAGGALGDDFGNNYINNIDNAIDTFERRINAFKGYNTNVDQLQGDIAEFWHGETFNINAAVNDSNYRVNVDRIHDFASPDITGNWETSDYGLKYYKYADKSIEAQATSYYERYKIFQKQYPDTSFEDFLIRKGVDVDALPYSSIYSGQMRLIPHDQYEASLAYLNIKIQRLLLTRPEQAARYIEVRELLTTKITAPDGTSSIEIDRSASERIAKLAKEGKFDAADEGITIPNLVQWEHILQQGVKAGLSASVITMVMKTAPSLYRCLDNLLTHGYITDEQMSELGGAAISGSSEGFVRGFVAGMLCVACKAGKFGSSLMAVSPGVIGAATVVILQTLKDSISLVKGDITRVQLLNNLNKSIIVSGFAIGTGLLFKSILPIIPFSYLLGNMVGSFVGSFAYKAADKAVMSFAVEYGWTFFGLVDQDYRLPDSIMEEIGVDVFDYEDSFVKDELLLDKFQFDTFAFDEFSPEMVRIVRRGIIAVHQVGYLY